MSLRTSAICPDLVMYCIQFQLPCPKEKKQQKQMKHRDEMEIIRSIKNPSFQSRLKVLNYFVESEDDLWAAGDNGQ